MSATNTKTDAKPPTDQAPASTTTQATATVFKDPFSQRSGDEALDTSTPVLTAKRDRRLSREWDASKTPPSRFQRPPGSIYATPASRDGHIERNKIHGFKEKVLELSGGKK